MRRFSCFHGGLLLAALILIQASWVKADATPEALTSAQVGKMLKELGGEPEMLSADVYQVSLNREGWKVHVMVSLTQAGDRIWLESKFAPVPDPELVPATAWLRLLEENERISPAHFAFDKNDKRIHLYKSFDNTGVTSTRLKKELDDFDSVVRRTQSLWRSENFAPLELLPSPRSNDDEPKKQSRLDGTWRIIRLEAKNESITDEQLSPKRPTVVFDGETAVIQTGLEPERKVRVKLNAEAKPPEIDFIDDKNRVEAGIYAWESGLLVICFASAGEPRPRQFITEAKSRNWLLVLKKQDPEP